MIPTKPTDVTWTDDQWKAIWASEQDVLVAAAAGSGKTAVLVERMIQKIVRTDAPIDVDQLLVVTFTNASAAEMKHRIGEAIERAIEKDPSSRHLRRQMSLLNKSSISTLHSFCLEVIRTYYYLIDIDPGFRIADDTEAELLKDDVMEQLLEEEYSKDDNEAFFTLVDALTSDRNDNDLQQLIRKLHTFSRSHADPDRWLDEIVSMYAVAPGADLESLPIMQDLRTHIQLELEGAEQLILQALSLANQPGGPAPRIPNFEDDLKQIRQLQEEPDWAHLFDRFQAVSFGRLKPCKGEEYEQEWLEQTKKWRDQAKKTIDTLKETYFSRLPESYLDDMRAMVPQLLPLIELVKAFHNRFSAEKAERGLVDFSDLEHYCLAILGEWSPDGLKPSDAAIHYREKFSEVLVDEYQDTNMVQETILQLVKRGTEKNGNLFMVGDVKQSIYRFRLAEPNLFLSKYRTFNAEGEGTGMKIDLSRNFRSRREVLDGTNFIFKQVMGTRVGEIEYDRDAELVPGAAYPEEKPFPIEIALIDQATDRLEQDLPEEVMDQEELEKSVLEARYMIRKIRSMVDEGGVVYDAKRKLERPIEYRDIVILMRSMTWTPEIMEEFKRAGIPLYANVSTGYFEATEVAIMLSLLKVIDNPHQDIPLASVLRSPVVRCTEEQLALIRTAASSGTFYDAVQSFYTMGGREEDEELQEKLGWFLSRLSKWRSMARTGALAELIWQLYRDTHFYDFVGGIPGGKQRQANLRALYDRARQYEATSFRGLFRFLRFVDRMRERGDDLGAARALSEKEDVVRLMTIHSSKGLEFPVVFIAGMGRAFNDMDLKNRFLLDKDYGLAMPYVQPEKRLSIDSLPQLAFKEKKRLELLAEEMRVLYVALTRAKEKLFLVATSSDAAKLVDKWAVTLHHKEWLLPDYIRKSAKSYMDWIGYSVIRHRDFALHSAEQSGFTEAQVDPSRFSIAVIPAVEIEEAVSDPASSESYLEQVRKHQQVPVQSARKEDVYERLTWSYAFDKTTKKRSKQSVSEIKRLNEVRDEQSASDLVRKNKTAFDRPSFLQETGITATERGTIMHTVMQHIPQSFSGTKEELEGIVDQLIKRELISAEQAAVISQDDILAFFGSPVGKRMLNATRVQREVPFTYSAHASELGLDGDANDPHDQVLLQGVIDCLFEDGEGLVLLDYKTDRITDRYSDLDTALRVMERRYRMQLTLYKRAIEGILGKQVKETVLFFFDGAHTLSLDA